MYSVGPRVSTTVLLHVATGKDRGREELNNSTDSTTKDSCRHLETKPLSFPPESGHSRDSVYTKLQMSGESEDWLGHSALMSPIY